MPEAQLELEAAKAVKPSTEAVGKAVQNVGSLIISQGINTVASTVTSVLAIADNQQSWQCSQAKLRYANTVNYNETNIALGSITLNTESYYYTALPKEEIRKHIADTFN